jgi:L-fucose mutarotase
MLKTTLLHPDILRACAQAGHHSRILIADGNYPVSSKRGPHSEIVSLQLSPGVPTVAQVLSALLSTIPVDEIHLMGLDFDDPYSSHGEPSAWAEYREIAATAGIQQLDQIKKWDFYKAVQSTDHVLTIQTADQALWANVLLTIGCRTP